MEAAITAWADVVFADATVILDGATFTRCTFRNCVLVYAASSPLVLDGCSADGCTWHFDGAAERTINVLRALRRLDPDVYDVIIDGGEEDDALRDPPKS